MAHELTDGLEPPTRGLLRIELNLAKFASFIFAPSHTRRDERARAKVWIVNPSSESKVLARILVEPVQDETLNTFDHRTSLALQKLWWEGAQDLADGSKVLTIRELARTMRLTWGKQTFILLKASLRRLRKVPITWTYAFYDSDAKQLASLEEPLTILAGLRLRQLIRPIRKKTEALETLRVGEDATADLESATSSFRFNEYIERNLRNGHTKPVFFDVAMNLRGEIALGLYAFLDIVMATKDTWERRTKELLENDLTVRGTYPYPSHRRDCLLGAVRELQGKPLSTGILKLALVKTKDDQDYKLVVKKAPFRARTRRIPAPRDAYLVDEIVDLTRDPGSRPYFAKVVAELGAETMRAIMSETRQADLEHRITTTKARYLTDLTERYRGNKPRGLSS